MVTTVVSPFHIMNTQKGTMESFTTGALNLSLALQKPVPKDYGLKEARDQTLLTEGSYLPGQSKLISVLSEILMVQ